MGFDNECILNIQSLPGEYFCPVCRLLVYPNEALQSQCTHLYCKPCLTYIVSTTQACPYDGYLVTEADSKPLVESNKALAETIGKITVHCLFHRSGCTWQGPLSECTSHCSGCAFGNSPVVCNRCAIQIVHRQVQEHAQHCPGVQPQISQSEGARNAAAAGAAVTAGQTQVASLARESTSQVQTQTTATPPPVNDPNQQPSSTSQPQALMQGAVPNAEQWYQQQLQYQQYYQQYPGYNPYQQHYQQYYPYQQQAVAQYQQVQPQSQSQPQMQQQGQSQPAMQPQARQPPALSERQLQPSHPPVQAVSAQPQNQAQVNQQQQANSLPHGAQAPSFPQAQAPSFPQSQAPSFPQSQAPSFPHSQAASYPSAHAQLYSQAQPPQPHPIQPHIQQMQMPQYQQTQSQIQHNQPQIQHPVPQPLPQFQSNPQALQAQVQHHPQPQSHPQLRPSLINRPQVQQTAANAVTSHQPQSHHQIPLTGPPQPPMYVHPQNAAQSLPKNQFPQQTSLMSPQLSHATVSNQMQSLLPSSGQASSVWPTQQLPVHPQAPLPAASVSQLPVMHPVQQPMPHQYVQQQQQPFAGQHQQGSFMQQQMPVLSQLRPQGPQHLLQQHPHAYSQSQQNFALTHGMQPHHPHSLGQPLTPNYGVQTQSYQQAATSVKGTPAQVSANQSSSNQSNLSWANNQVQLASQQQAGTKPEMHVKQEIAMKISHERETESSSNKTAKTDNSDVLYVGPAAVVGMKVPKSETDVKPVVDEMKAEIEDKTNVVDTSSTDFELHALESAEPVNRKIVKEEVVENVEDRRDSANIDIKQEEHSMSKEAHDGSLLKTPPMQQGGKFGQQTGEVLKEQKLALAQGAQGPGALPPAGQIQAGGFVQSPPSLSRSSTLHQSPSAPSMVQAPLLGAVHQTQDPTEFRPSMFKPRGVEISPGAIPGSGPIASFGRGAGPHGLYEHGFEPPSDALQRSYNLGHPPHVGNPVGGPPIRSGPPSAFNSQGGIVTGPAYGPEGETGQKQPSNLMEAKILTSHRAGYVDGRRSESHFPLEPPPGIQSNMMRMNGAPGLDFRDQRFKSFPDERLNPFPMDQARHVIDRGEFEKDLKQFPRPSPLDAEHVPKLESHFHSSRSFDRGPRFGMDMGPRSFERGQSYESGFKLDPMGGSAPSRFSPSYQDGAAGRPNSSHAYPDFPRPGSAYGRPHMGGLSPRSVREGIDGREFHRFGDPIGSSIHETRFPFLPGHLRRDEFEGPGRNGDYGQDFLPNHLKMGEPLGPHNLRLGETGGLGGFPGHARMGDLTGPGNFPQPRLGEPGFRSRFSRQGFPSDGGFCTGNLESFDNSRKRKPPTMGWCRICKVDCETVDGLDLHSQTREHQKMALDMVLSIKENAKKQKLSSSDRVSNDDLNKSRNVNFDGRGKKH